jgi:hypothetical protein
VQPKREDKANAYRSSFRSSYSSSGRRRWHCMHPPPAVRAAREERRMGRGCLCRRATCRRRHDGPGVGSVNDRRRGWRCDGQTYSPEKKCGFPIKLGKSTHSSNPPRHFGPAKSGPGRLPWEAWIAPGDSRCKNAGSGASVSQRAQAVSFVFAVAHPWETPLDWRSTDKREWYDATAAARKGRS